MSADAIDDDTRLLQDYIEACSNWRRWGATTRSVPHLPDGEQRRLFGEALGVLAEPY